MSVVCILLVYVCDVVLVVCVGVVVRFVWLFACVSLGVCACVFACLFACVCVFGFVCA